MSKTPYEIRLEVLRLAQDHITAKFWNDWEKLNIEREHKRLSLSNASRSAASAFDNLTVPVFPTTEQILAEAAKFKNFVDQE